MSRLQGPVRLALACLAATLCTALAAQDARQGWVDVDYGALVDRRQLSHSGEPVGVLLDKLAGRPLPPPGSGAADRVAHSLLEPLLEPYAFILSDALDRLGPQNGPPMVELGSLWEAGESQPAWVELLRARRLIVESDGAGRMRLCLPWSGRPGESAATAAQAYRQWWPILRSIFDAEIRRLGAGAAEPVSLEVEIHPYLHAPERTRFLLGLEPHRVTVDDTRSDGSRPPLSLSRWQAFLDSGWQLEGGRLESDGSVRLIGSRREDPPTILGRRLTLADLAVAYRAVFHGGLAQPYMSLDRGGSPQMSTVNYGGRLRDTALGLVSLLCDIRFKTFSLGVDIVEGRDLREKLRGPIPEFRTHLERFAADPRSAQVNTQQTRLWFYPDRVDLTVSPQGDLLALRRVRMSAASERVLDESGTAASGEDPPWTRATVEAINRDYDELVPFFSELADLDQVVRLLSFFTWLKQAQSDGLLTPDLDPLMSIQLPAVPTPRTFPQLLAFNALPAADSAGQVQVFDRVPVAEALERLNPADGRPLPASRRFRRAMAALDPQDAQQAQMLSRYREYDPAQLDPVELDLLAHRAERLRMHETVLLTLDTQRREAVAARHRRGETLRIFSVGIGGLDLGMEQALKRAGGRSVLLASNGGASRSSTEGSARPVTVEPRDAWRREGAGAAPPTIRPHGASAGRNGQHRVELGGADAQRWIFTVAAADSPDVRSRRRFLDGSARSVRFERVEARRSLHFRLDGDRSNLVAVAEAAPRRTSTELPPQATDLPEGLALMSVAPSAGDESQLQLRLRLEGLVSGVPRQLETFVPRSVLQRLVMGQEADRSAGSPLPALAPLPAALGVVETLMLHADPGQRRRPWEEPQPPLAGEEDPVRLARALGRWTIEGPDVSAPPQPTVVGTEPATSARRWDAAPLPRRAALWLPEAGFPAPAADSRERIRSAWRGTIVDGKLPDSDEFDLLLVVTAEAPGLFAARLRELAADPAMEGKLLAAWCLSGGYRSDLAASLLEEGKLAGLGLAETTVVGLRDIAAEIGGWSAALASAPAVRVEALGGPFLWYF